MGRRGNGEGSIVHRKDGLWQGAISCGRDPTSGKWKRVTVYGRTRAEVADKLDQLRNQQRAGLPIEPQSVTVGQWIETWLQEYKKASLKPTTWSNYWYLYRVHIRPALGETRLAKLQTNQIQQFYQASLTNGFSPASIRRLHAVLTGALKQARREGLIPRNPAEDVVLPKARKKERRVLTPEETERFLAAAQKRRLYPSFLVAVGTGMRVGELLALRWEDVDLDAGVVRVRREVIRLRDQPGPTKTKLAFMTPKSQAGIREIPLTATVLAELRRWKARQAEEKLALGEAYRDQGLVFAGEDGRITDPRNFTKLFYKVVKDAGIPHANLHALRHSFATRLAEAGENPRIIADLLGHAQVTTTLEIYSHALPEAKRAAVSKLDDILKAQKAR